MGALNSSVRNVFVKLYGTGPCEVCRGGRAGAAGAGAQVGGSAVSVGGSTNPVSDCQSTVIWPTPDRTRFGPGVRAGCVLPVLVRHMLLGLILQFPSCVQFYFYLACPFIPFAAVG